MKVKSESEATQSCPTGTDPMDCSPPGSSIHGIFQARVLEWGAIAFEFCTKYAKLKFKILELSQDVGHQTHQMRQRPWLDLLRIADNKVTAPVT